MSNYPATCHTSKMTKIQSKNSVSKGLNYDSDKTRTKESFDLARQEKYEIQDSIQQPVKDINNYIKYMNNQAKVYDPITKKYLITSLNCDNTLNVNEEFRQIEQLYHSHKNENLSKDKKPNEAFRLYINFNGHNIQAHKVHEISTEIAKRICGNEYKCLISTHTNTNNYHSHILINAYNNDGWHKLKEELKIGLKWQRISNIVALENGCDILMTFNDKSDINNTENENIEPPKPQYKSKNEYQTSIKNKLGKDILLHDINETLQNPNITNWQQYVSEMQIKGWQFNKNKANTIIYYKQNFMTTTKNGYMRGFIRESRLGVQYTKRYIEQFLKSKQNEYYISNKIKKINYNEITPFLKDKIMTNRLPLVFRVIKLMIKLVKNLIQNEYEIILKNPQQESQIKQNTILLKAKLKELEKLEKDLNQYNLLHPNHIIENDTDLKIIKNNLLKQYKIYENELKNFDKIKNINDIMNSIKEIETNKELIQKYNLYDTLYQDISNININENLAKLDPMNPKTKSRLYNAIHNSNFILTTPFNQLTESKAKELIYFLSNQKKNPVGTLLPQDKSWEYYSHNYKLYKNNEYMQFRGNIIPTELIPKNQYNSYKTQQNKQKRTKNNDNLIQEQNKYKIFKANNNIRDNEYDKILKLKNHIYKLKSFGINKIDEIDNIKNILNNRINILNETKESFKETKLNLKLINQLESYFNNETNNYKPILNIIENNTFNNMKDYFIKRFNTTTEIIILIYQI